MLWLGDFGIYIYKQEHQVVRGVDNQLELWLMVAWSKGCSGEGGNVFFGYKLPLWILNIATLYST